MLFRSRIVGHDLGTDDPPRQGAMLVCATEVHDKAAIDRFVAALEDAIR